MDKLIAKREFYYRGHRYIPGEEVKCEDPKMVSAWLRAESVKIHEENQSENENPDAGEKQQENENPDAGEKQSGSDSSMEGDQDFGEPLKATPAAAEAGIPAEGEDRMIGKPERNVGRRKK